RARADTSLMADLEIMMPHLQSNITRVQSGHREPLEWDPPRDRPAERDTPRGNGKRRVPDSGLRVVSAAPLTEPHPLALDGKLTEEWLVEFIRSEMAQRKFTRALVG